MGDIAPGHKERASIGLQVDFATQLDISADDAVRAKSSVPVSVKQERKVLEDKAYSAGPSDFADMQRTTEWSFPEGYLRPPGALGTEPELTALFEALFGEKHVGASTTLDNTAPAPTTTGGRATSVAGLAKGALVRITGGALNARGEIVRLKTVDAGARDITWEPALSAAPLADAPVRAGVSYFTRADFEKVCTILRDLVHTTRLYPGCWVNKGTFKWAKDDLILAAFEGQGCGKEVVCGTSKIADAGGIDAVELTLNVPAGEEDLFDLEDGHAFAYLDEGTASEEIVKFTAQAGTALTMERAQKGSTGKVHAQNAPITPWRATRTLVGEKITGIDGFFFYVDAAGTRRSIPFDGMEVSLDNSFEGRTEAGTEPGARYAFGVQRSGPHRTVSFNISAKYRRIVEKVNRLAKKGTKVGVVMTAGATEGLLFAAVMPRVAFDAGATPDAPNGSQDTMLPFTGRAFVSSETEDDDISVGFL